MPNIQINIKDKVARADRVIIVCDNSDYTAVFDFDDEWSAYDTKTARFVYGGTYTDVVFSGNSCPIPEIHDTRSLTVGVYAGDLHTTTPAYISCVPSILCGNGIPADPTPEVYAQIMELLNKESGIWYPAVDDAGNMSWTRSMSETEPQPVNIKGPKGDAGADGIGIPGADGKDGVDGKSAYELAQDNGFAGTMQEWLASLVGADGANGADGKDGISPAVSVAAITGGNRVTITDSEGAKTFDVMDGAQGASGADGKDYVLTDTDKQEIAKTAAGLVDVPSVQPDWNQNDSTQPDYVKNRPFYTGDPVETVLVEESTVSFSFSESEGAYMGRLKSAFSATVRETYKVSWDGTVYECACVDFNGIPCIGNLSIAGAGSDTGEPFLMVVNNGREIAIGTADTSASHTVSISRFAPEVVKIDPKYIRDMYYTGDPVETVLVEESTVSFAGTPGLYMGQLESTFEATVGETYKVSWDGTAYECACVNFNNNSTIGNLSIAGAGSDTGEPFLIVVNPGGRIKIGTADTSASHTVSISGFVSEVVKIDEKYLPDVLISEISTLSSDVSTLSSDVSTLSSDVSTKMDKANPTGRGSFSLNRKGGTTIGQYSFAEGYDTTASKYCSHTEGLSTKASSESQHVQGKYNIEDSSGVYTHIVGNGGSDSHRSNAHTLDWSGNAWFAGDVYVGSTSGTNKDNGSKKLAIAPKILSITLSASSWDSTALTQTVTATGVLSDEMAQFITPTPALASQSEYYDAGILCTGQAANSLTFKADTAPTADITVYVKIEEVDAV